MSYRAAECYSSSPPYDAFLSFAGPDREQCRNLYAHMSEAGLSTFFDETNIQVGESITRKLQQGISSSKLFVAYYSRHFTHRNACQAELSAAYIAAQQSGNSGRFIVLNPEESTDHIFPKSLTNPEHLISAVSMSNSMASIAQVISSRALSLHTTIGTIPHNYHPKWNGPRRLWVHNLTRYPKLWDIHTALFDNRDVKSDSSSILVTGQSGVGKTSAVSRYVHCFETAFSNVHWYRYGQPNDLNNERMSVADQTGRLNVRIIDDIPPDISSADLQRRFPPVPNVHNILIGVNDRLQNALPTVTIDDLSPGEARAFISRYRSPESKTESEALDRLVGRINGNASIVHQVALRLEDMQGIISYDDIEGFI